MDDFKIEKVTSKTKAIPEKPRGNLKLAGVLMAAVFSTLLSCTPGIPADPDPVEYEFRLTIKGDAYTNIVLSNKTDTLIPAFVFVDQHGGAWFKFVNNIYSPRYYLYEFTNFNTQKIVALYLQSSNAMQAVYSRSVWISYHFGMESFPVRFVYGLYTLGKGGTNINMEDAFSATNLVIGGDMMFVSNNYYTNTSKVQGYITNSQFVREVYWNEGVPAVVSSTAVKFKAYIVKP